MQRRKNDGVRNLRPDRCLNCGEPLHGTYCAKCGQSHEHPRLRTRAVLGDAFDHLFDLDIPLLRTLVRLSTRPGHVCREYIEGRRRPYSNPIRYAVITAAVYVLALVIFDVRPSSVFLDTTSNAASEMGVPDVSADTPEAAGVSPEAERARQRALISRYIGTHAPRVVEESLNVVSLLTFPVLASGLLVLFRRQRRTYAEHLVFVLFVFGHALLINTVAALAGLAESLAGLAVIQAVDLAYGSWAAVVFYKTGIASTVLRMVAIAVLYYVFSIAVGFVIVMSWILWLFTSGQIFERIQG